MHSRRCHIIIIITIIIIIIIIIATVLLFLMLLSADSLTVGFVKHILCGHFHLVPLMILIWYICFLLIKM